MAPNVGARSADRSDLRFTVVVPTRNRPHSLVRCLAALQLQDGCGEFEIIVVDDGSRAVKEVSAIVAASPRARLVRVPPSGSARARNRGITEARASSVLLLDDDCEAQPGWAAAMLAALGDSTPVAAGRCINADRTDSLGEATQTVLDYLTIQSLRPNGSAGFAPTYNIAGRRDVLLEIPFDERYVNSGADRDWCSRLAQRGYQIAHAPDAVVEHRQTLDLASFWRKHRAYGKGSARFHHAHSIGLESPPFYMGLVRQGFGRGAKAGLAVCVAQAATAVGFAYEVFARRRATLRATPE
jgi:mycofactocin glycosyltransferase